MTCMEETKTSIENDTIKESNKIQIFCKDNKSIDGDTVNLGDLV